MLSVDGFGDFASTAFGFGSSSSLLMDRQVFFPHSLGAFYTAITQYLGFPNYGDEYKVMGLAPYGQPNFISQLRQVVRPLPQGCFELDLRFFKHASERIPHQWSNGSPVIGNHYSKELVSFGPTT